jgi:hypothetical protein
LIAPFYPLDEALDSGIIAPVLNHLHRVRDGRAIAIEHEGDVLLGAAQQHMGEVDRRLAGSGRPAKSARPAEHVGQADSGFRNYSSSECKNLGVFAQLLKAAMALAVTKIPNP